MTKHKPIFVSLLLCILFFNLPISRCQEGIWWVASPEPRINLPKYKLDLRLRPFDYILETKPDGSLGFQLCRWEAYAGRNVGKFKFFLMAKLDRVGGANRYWGGLRGDFNTRTPNKKFDFHLQYRYFLGYTPESKSHQYLIYMAQYAAAPKLKIGVLGWAQHTFGRPPYWFTGPSVVYTINQNLSALASFDKDLFRKNLYLGLVGLNIAYTWNKDKTAK